ncbi:hypothetical protein IQ265_23240 [Nodosilinea sp. LEGE 06152]|uniref:hypothetical protein n=1 Tax=Nodosilinea sp. LEGE 06152 TaxID=2777966 RepID=UPI00187E2BB7|nr:hypothetical protein [Nodosilinea sp. LEGE 06152]MBE9159727.1 hypothetical protein [Nodosilinea sp. LEGE 06152]
MGKAKLYLWGLIGLSAGLAVLSQKGKDLDQSTQPVSPAEYQAEVSKAIAEITDMDAQGDMRYQPNYEAAILGLDARCPEKLSSVLNLSFNEIEARGEDGIQFALLNELEDTLYIIEQSGQQPTECATFISQSSYE